MAESCKSKKAADIFERECDEHFRNICESGAQEVSGSPAAANEVNRLSETSDMDDIDEDTTPITLNATVSKPTAKKKKQQKPPAHYLTPTAASKAMRRDKSPRAATGVGGMSVQMIPSMATTNPKTMSMLRTEPVWIEDLPINELKLTFSHFQTSFSEFIILSEITTIILWDMGIVLKSASKMPPKRSQTERAYSDLTLSEEELEMTDLGVFESEEFSHLHMNTSDHDIKTPQVPEPCEADVSFASSTGDGR